MKYGLGFVIFGLVVIAIITGITATNLPCLEQDTVLAERIYGQCVNNNTWWSGGKNCRDAATQIACKRWGFR